MTDEDNIHPVVRLLAARMESHPEEFCALTATADITLMGRWDSTLKEIRKWASPEELRLLSRVPLDALHREVLDELLNGPERRAEEERAHEAERQRWQAQTMASQSNAYSPPGQLGLGQQGLLQQGILQQGLAKQAAGAAGAQAFNVYNTYTSVATTTTAPAKPHRRNTFEGLRDWLNKVGNT
jgi:hypothetical protein